MLYYYTIYLNIISTFSEVCWFGLTLLLLEDITLEMLENYNMCNYKLDPTFRRLLRPAQIYRIKGGLVVEDFQVTKTQLISNSKREVE